MYIALSFALFLLLNTSVFLPWVSAQIGYFAPDWGCSAGISQAITRRPKDRSLQSADLHHRACQELGCFCHHFFKNPEFGTPFANIEGVGPIQPILVQSKEN
jgi:hypothetical protein